MSKLEELLKGVDVEWIKLGNEQFIEIANNGRKPVKASLRSSGEIPYYGANNIQDYVEGFTHDGEYVLIAEDGSSSLENYSIQYANGKFWANNHVHVLKGKNSIETKFLYYYLKIINFTPYLTGGERAKLTKGRMLEIQIPIPPIEIQQEIVRVLDELTSLTNQLKTELETERQNRKKQFDFFREQLFTFEEDENNYVALGELAENLDSKRKPITSSQRKPGKIPYYGASGIVDYVKDYIFDGDYLLVSEDGANLLARSTPIAFSISGKTWVNNHAHILEFGTSDERLFAEYYLNSIDLSPYITGAAQPKLNKSNLNSIKIPNPPLEVKKHIVNLLDQFDAAHTVIEEELTKEIKLRTQQYEYYREKLLTFPKN